MCYKNSVLGHRVYDTGHVFETRRGIDHIIGNAGESNDGGRNRFLRIYEGGVLIQYSLPIEHENRYLNDPVSFDEPSSSFYVYNRKFHLKLKMNF